MTREEAIKILADLTDNLFLHTWEEQYKALHMAIEALSVDRPRGEWIKHEIEDTCRWVECSECHKEYPNIEMNFCPNCGKRMEKINEK